MSVENVFDALEKKSKADLAVGIHIAKLLDGEGVSYYATRLMPGLRINRHYHSEGSETYLILEGSGLIHTWSPEEQGVRTRKVHCGSIFDIPPNVAHQLENDSSEPLVLIFICKPSHLADDRVLV
jgi:quercetin dioxygenase-like cupin family protein